MGPLLAVPNFSEGRDRDVVEEIAAAAERAGAHVLDLHLDPDHNRSVITLAAPAGALAEAVLCAAEVATARINLEHHHGEHPRVGATDVAPVVYLEDRQRGAACVEALVLGDLLGTEIGLPVFLYGILAGGRSRAELRRGGPRELARRVAEGELKSDFGPSLLDLRHGAALVGARPPLIAFNLELGGGASLEVARAIAARVREGGQDGLPGVRAIALELHSSGIVQVSTNIEDHRRTRPLQVLQAVQRHAEVNRWELVGLAPAEALAGLPPSGVGHPRTIEEALGRENLGCLP